MIYLVLLGKNTGGEVLDSLLIESPTMTFKAIIHKVKQRNTVTTVNIKKIRKHLSFLQKIII